MNSIPIQGNGPLFNKVFKWCDLSAQSDDSVKFFKVLVFDLKLQKITEIVNNNFFFFSEMAFC